MEIYLDTEEFTCQWYWYSDGIESHTHTKTVHVRTRDGSVFMYLLYTLKQEPLVTILHYFRQQPLIFCVYAMKIWREHGIICVDINVLLFLERRATLKKWLVFSIHSSHVGLLRGSRPTRWELVLHNRQFVLFTILMAVWTSWYLSTASLLTCFICRWLARVSAIICLLFFATSWSYAWFMCNILESSLAERMWFFARSSNIWGSNLCKPKPSNN